jgi:hypothetical protein
MSTAKKIGLGCALLPVLLIGSCFGKMAFDAKMYDLPGQVLQSSAAPTRSLKTPLQVAEALDAYVQPRFEILRDKNFGAFRIVYRKHAGLVQLKVDTQEEKEQIANVNAANRDYMICLLHCAPKPERGGYQVTPKLELLYFNQQKIVRDMAYFSSPVRVSDENGFDWEAVQKKAIAVMPQLMAGREHRAGDTDWDVLMRPVLASKQECLNCHTEARPGATLGVMVYAVRKTTRLDPVKLGLR